MAGDERAITRKGLEARGYGRSELRELRVNALSDHLAVLGVAAMRYRADGGELEGLRAAYTLRKTDEGWKIVTITVLQPSPSHPASP